MPVNDTTSNRGYQKPNIANTLADDVGRLRSALDSIDTDMVGKASSTHTHGNITNAGAIGATANLPVITGTSGVLEAGSFGTTANTFCQGNDARLSEQTITLTGDVTGTGTGSFTTAIASGVIVNADVNASAAIAGTKISPDFGSQNVVTTGNLQGASINGGPLAGFRNAIINGNFDHWQRGTSSSGVGYVAADRWINSLVGSTNTQSRQVFTLGQTSVPGEPKFFCRQVVGSVAGASNAAALQQKIEDVRTFAGQQVTVSFWAKADAAKPIAVELYQDFGTGGSPSAAVTGLGVNKVTLSTSWQKITTTVALPSISGKTLGTDDNDNLRLQIWFDAGSSFNSRTNTLGQQSGTFDIAQVQVERGPVATPFERRPIGTELALCQRYYESNFASLQSPVANVDFMAPYGFKVTKRAAPTMATVDAGSDINITSSSFFSPNVDSVGLQIRASVAGGYKQNWRFTASAEL